MTPQEKYGAEFYCERRLFPKADGSKHPYYDILVCITPKHDAASTLDYAWGVMRELAEWTCEEFKEEPKNVTYRITVAWSKDVRKGQGHIVKVWNDLAGVREVAQCATPEACAARFGPGWTPFTNWQKDVFEQKA